MFLGALVVWTVVLNLSTVVAVLNCKSTKIGAEYAGVVSQTVGGRTCQNWSSQTPHSHKIRTNYPEGSEDKASNFCRNPDDSPDGPWCYTTDPKVTWEYCDVKLCCKCKKTKIGVEYAGGLSKTVGGKTCQNWASQTPHSHKEWTNFPEGSESNAKNFCRNPDNSTGGPWCYTTDSKVRWDYCDVKTCDCKKTKIGAEYAGVVFHTVGGRVCQNWASQTPHSHKEWTNLPDGSEKNAGNFCRNPDNSPDGPWCYTTDEKVRWEYCDVKLC
jgi:integrin beta 3